MDELGRVGLRALVELARRGSIAAVAEDTGYTAGAVSQQIARLESVVGHPLTVRSGRGVRLTDVGRVLAEEAVAVLRAEEAALAAARAARTEVRGQLRIGVFGSTAATLLAPLVLRSAQVHPGLRLTSREVDVDDTAAAVRRGEVDVAFGVEYPDAPMPRRPETELVPLLTERFALAVSPEVPGPGRTTLSAAARWPWILTPACTPFGAAVRNACRSAGFEPDVLHEVTDTSAALLLAGRGLGVTPVTPLMRRLGTEPVRVLELDDVVERRIVLVRHRADAGRATVRALTEVLRAVTAEEPVG
ncbi:LysR family transcriptional regulator [Kineococcus aurantiacus]|uniref:DNA-binding transcriptional LysR family regulator n=1 Tax=Kineococcus aurantiacus TaxID=37633 RepID=A0A7Y9DMB8_9ACTN|nr:LysR family transcriptional regulator [Kineococcus aurantiacus]NYD23220.1 DNA-binding transcriptional LysR family regulator [Kineococcus aurantiacus]